MQPGQFVNPFQPQQPQFTQPQPQFTQPQPVQTQTAPAQYVQPAPPQGFQQPTQPASQTPPGGSDEFGAPAPRADGPRIPDSEGRLLLVMPKRLELNLPNRLQPGTFQDRMTCDIVILDGGPIAYGGRPEDGVPHTKQEQTPLFVKGRYVSQKGLINQLTTAYDNFRRGSGTRMVLGRLRRGTPTEPGRKPPWLLDDPTPQDQELARAWLRSNPQDAFTSP